MQKIEMLMLELEEEVKMHPPPHRMIEVQRIIDNGGPNVLIELANAPEDIQERIKELDEEKEEIWEWIHEEAQLHNVKYNSI